MAGRVRAWTATPLLPILVFGLFRLVDAGFFILGARSQPRLVSSGAMTVVDVIPASPGYWQVLTNWDAQWYEAIALNGYPESLPEVDGIVQRSEWAFYPVYPFLVRGAMFLSGMPFELAAGLLSLAAGGVAMWLLHAFLLERVTEFTAGATVAVICAFPTAPLMQAAYTESLALLLLILVIRSLARRRYVQYCTLVLLLGLTRPVALPLLAVVAVHWLVVLRSHDRDGPSARVWLPVSLGATALAGGAWPLIVGTVTGVPSAFVLTQQAWRGSGSTWATGTTAQFFAVSPLMGVLVLLVLGYFMTVALHGRAWGPEWRAWTVAYPVFILTLTPPTMSLARFMLLLGVAWWPVPTTVGARQSVLARRFRWVLLAGLIGAGLLGQYFWVTEVFTIDVSPSEQLWP